MASSEWFLRVVEAVHKPNFVLCMRSPAAEQRSFIWDTGCPVSLATYPGARAGQPSNAPLFGLAPGGVYRASPVTRGTGALLPHRFTLTPQTMRGGLLSAALSFASPRLHVMEHPALWCSDFPPGHEYGPAIVWTASTTQVVNHLVIVVAKKLAINRMVLSPITYTSLPYFGIYF